MADVVVTVPKGIWLDWIYEGDAVGEPATGEEWGFFLGGSRPEMVAGDRVYVVAHGRLRGFAPLTRIATTPRGCALCRNHGAEAVTIAEPIQGFRGWRYRWWDRALEVPFPGWTLEGVTLTTAEQRHMAALLQQGKARDAG